MNAKVEFFGDSQSNAEEWTDQQVTTCPICDGWGVNKEQDACPYCDKGLIKSTSHGWVILAAELAGELPMDAEQQ